MGIEYYTTRFLFQARRAGLNFGRVLTIGRQDLVMNARDLERLAREFQFDPADLTKIEPASRLNYVDPLLTQLLKAAEVESIDASDYEQATHVHDLNQPLPAGLRERYDTVIEAGSLEHIFNLPVALKNLMEAVKVGGTLFIQTPANNYFGHGFYQFSPELFFRTLNAENGFELKRVEVFEHCYPGKFYRTQPHAVTDAAKINRRVLLVNNRPTLLLAEARRVSDKPIFANTPQQSFYTGRWETKTASAPPPSRPPRVLKKRFKDIFLDLPLWLTGRLWLQYRCRGEKPALSNRKFFQPKP